MMKGDAEQAQAAESGGLLLNAALTVIAIYFLFFHGAV